MKDDIKTTGQTQNREYAKVSLYLLTASLFLIFSIILYGYILRIPPEKQESRRSFPEHFSEWTAENVNFDEQIMTDLSPDSYVYKTYEMQGSVPVTLVVLFYDTMEKADLSHSPIVCFTGQGWDILKTEEVNLPVKASKTEKITVNQLTQKKADITMITLFWYQNSDSVFVSRGIHKVDLFVRRLLGKSDTNAFIRVNGSISDGRDIKKLKVDLYQFVYDSFPELRRCFFEE